MPTAIVSGALANKPGNGGNAWTRLSWVRGLQRLGFAVVFVEQIKRADCHDAQRQFFDAAMRQFGLERASALIDEEGVSLAGLSAAELRQRAAAAELLFNITGHLSVEAIRGAPRWRIYYDDDPGYTQFWSEGARLAGHDFYFTIGQNIGTTDCTIPVGKIPWRHTRPPVVLDDWPVSTVDGRGRFTTVASWRGAYAPVEQHGKRYGVKAHEFRKFIELPERCPHSFEIALSIHPGDQKDLDALQRHGWRIADPGPAAGTPDAFRRYVQSSGAEFSVAQGIYVETNSAWFSDRTVRYLASGRPALVQETGFSHHLPVGDGLLAFRTLEEAVEGAGRIVRDYPHHCRAARQLAERYFDSDRVVADLLAQIGWKP